MVGKQNKTKNSKKKIEHKNQLKHSRNKRYKTLVKNCIKDVRLKITQKVGEEELKISTKNMQKILDKAVNKGQIHRNKASRLKSKYLYQKI